MLPYSIPGMVNSVTITTLLVVNRMDSSKCSWGGRHCKREMGYCPLTLQAEAASG